ncbi:unnamed protein product [Mytilus coruscus]|uniref:PID domain-containing protein n=1 Tax=Mytilus coruscus TaxID=42192 RepID=A0A6J8BH72_MYTCO|nr:unnamed protein product [Mytilus coruscus]
MEEPVMALIKRRVLYIGTSVSLETADGLEAVQKPLCDRYPVGENDHLVVKAIETNLIILNTGLQIQFIEEPDAVVFFPISSLTFCAAVRPVTEVNASSGEVMTKFVSLNSELTAQNTKNPAIFTAITRHADGKTLECHGFICASDKDALDIVKATTMAHIRRRRNTAMHK